MNKVLYPLWDIISNFLVPRTRIGVISVMVGFFYWGASWLHRPPKPPSAPTSTFEMRPPPSETSDASGAKGVTNPGETSQETSAQILGRLIKDAERELGGIDLISRSRTAELQTQNADLAKHDEKIHLSKCLLRNYLKTYKK